VFSHLIRLSCEKNARFKPIFLFLQTTLRMPICIVFRFSLHSTKLPTMLQAQEKADLANLQRIQDAAVKQYYAHRSAAAGWSAVDSAMLPASEAPEVARADAAPPAS
jgi:hypothetical protein